MRTDMFGCFFVGEGREPRMNANGHEGFWSGRAKGWKYGEIFSQSQSRFARRFPTQSHDYAVAIGLYFCFHRFMYRGRFFRRDGCTSSVRAHVGHAHMSVQ